MSEWNLWSRVQTFFGQVFDQRSGGDVHLCVNLTQKQPCVWTPPPNKVLERDGNAGTCLSKVVFKSTGDQKDKFHCTSFPRVPISPESKITSFSTKLLSERCERTLLSWHFSAWHFSALFRVWINAHVQLTQKIKGLKLNGKFEKIHFESKCVIYTINFGEWTAPSSLWRKDF